MVVERQHVSPSNASPEHQYQNGNSKRVRASSAIYRPPAARRMDSIRNVDMGSGSNIIAVSPKTEKTRSTTKQRRPDIQVYIPRAKRVEQELAEQRMPRSEVSSYVCNQSANGQRKSTCESQMRSVKTSYFSEKKCNTISTTCIRSPEDQVTKESKNVVLSSEKTSTEPSKESVRSVSPSLCKPYPDLLTSSEKFNEYDSADSDRRDNVINSESLLINSSECETESNTSSILNETDVREASISISSLIELSDNGKDDCSDENGRSTEDYIDVPFAGDNCSTHADLAKGLKENTVENKSPSICCANEHNMQKEEKDGKTAIGIEDTTLDTKNGENDLFLSQVKSVKNKERFPTDVLIISDPVPVSPTIDSSLSEERNSPKVPPEAKKKKSRVKSDQKCENDKLAPSVKSPTHLNRDECTWEMLFDDNGECLDPKVMDELSSAVGSVTVEKPQSNYDRFTTRNDLTLPGGDGEFAHVLEIYNFPATFKTQDLISVFSPYKNAGFEIKWVDDTHALGVFSSSRIAAEVLASDHPFVKTRPLCNATPESRSKARRSAEFLQPYKTRPETCIALARRLVTGALGVKLSTSREEREAERRLLREAKEKKRLAAQQQHDAWEGIIAEK